MQGDIIGTWILRTFRVENQETGAVSEPFGPDPRGVLILLPEGRMAAMLTPRDRTVPATDADRSAAFQKLVAYSGRYRLEAPDRFVTAVDVAWIEPWVGTDQVRTYSVSGDGLEIITGPSRMPQPDGTEATVLGRLSWTREVATSSD